MSRADELTDRLIDGALADAEALDLLALLGADPGARARHLAALRLELALRGLRAEFDLAGPTVARIESDRLDRTTGAVMAGLAARPAPAWGRPPRRRRGLWAAFAALAVVLACVWLARPAPEPAPVPDADAPSGLDLARLASLSGAVEIVGPDGAVAALRGQPVGPDRTLRTVGEESARCSSSPTAPGSNSTPTPRCGSRPDAGAGRSCSSWRAASPRWRPATGSSSGRAGRRSRPPAAPSRSGPPGPGRSASSRPTATCAWSAAGRRGPWCSARTVPPSSATTRRPSASSSRSRADGAPRARLDFMALDAGFAPDGEVWAASAKQWARWAPARPTPAARSFCRR
jgi:hypothetical protein